MNTSGLNPNLLLIFFLEDKYSGATSLHLIVEVKMQ